MRKLSTPEIPVYMRYVLSFGLVSIATIIKLYHFNMIGLSTPFLLYFGTVIVCSRWLGKGPAYFGISISLLAIIYFFMAPYGALAINHNQSIQLLLYTVEAWLLIGLSNALNESTKKNLTQMKLFEAIMAKSTDGIVVVDKDGKRTYCSPSVENVIGYSAEEYLKLPAWKLGHPDELERIKEQYKNLTESSGECMVLLHRMRHKNGKWIWVESRVTNSLDESGVASMIANFNNVTKRIETEQHLKDFIGIVSHELKSPLTSMKAYGQITLKKIDLKDDSGASTFALRMSHLTDRMLKLINDMLDVATINAGQLKLDIQKFDLNALVHEVVDSLQQTTDRHQLIINFSELQEISGDKEK
ncbi:PAS domain S-box protein [Pedobacter jejuensis]|uniref:histidine kinase n=1 Tax=Pedobacter jejuensis TaxID=1268550 RepID=A0A3N0BRX5_9SPHI|nr:PAS domain S-box protein [Pedobacter jejuensis]RNL51421.1 PAS domain S-box protein [Pedobacter jejuensis]